VSTNAILAAAMILVESGGNDRAVGDGGRAIGPLQIHAGILLDVNRRFGTRFTHRGMTNRADAVAVMDRYLWMYAQPGRLGRPVTSADRARIWNGGPNGWRKASTVGYAERVRGATR
jgi:hypothetical protein